MPKVIEGDMGVFLFPLSVYSKAFYSSLWLCSEVGYVVTAVVACLCVSFDNRHRKACLFPSLITVHYYFVLIPRVTVTTDLSDDERLVKGEYTLTTSSSPKRQLWASQLYKVIMTPAVKGSRIRICFLWFTNTICWIP